jgi:hypothetical protein
MAIAVVQAAAELTGQAVEGGVAHTRTLQARTSTIAAIQTWLKIAGFTLPTISAFADLGIALAMATATLDT